MGAQVHQRARGGDQVRPPTRAHLRRVDRPVPNRPRGERSIGRDAQDIELVLPHIGTLALEHIHDGTLRRFVEARRRAGIKASTINRTLAVVRSIMNLAARAWRDESGKTWVAESPMITLLLMDDAREAYPLSWAEQRQLFPLLPPTWARWLYSP